MKLEILLSCTNGWMRRYLAILPQRLPLRWPAMILSGGVSVSQHGSLLAENFTKKSRLLDGSRPQLSNR